MTSGARTRSASTKSSCPVWSPSRTTMVGLGPACRVRGARFPVRPRPLRRARGGDCREHVEEDTPMARVRRKTSAATRWNLEIAGIVALGFALLLGVALVVPPSRGGVIGGATAFALHALFGGAAWLFVALVALVAAIVFLEINVPRMIATLGGAACAYFLLVDTMYARHGGWVGRTLDDGARALVG